MNAQTIANVFLNIGAVALVFIALYRVIFPGLVADFRHELFALRRQLFLYMAKGNIEPNHPAYVRLRSTINGLLFRAEFVTGLQLLVSAFVAVKYADRYVRRTGAEIRHISDREAKTAMLGFHGELNRILARHLRRIMWLSPVMLFIYLLSMGFRAKNAMAKAVKIVEADGARIGMSSLVEA